MSKKICKLCNKEITKEDDYVRLTDYKKGKFFMEGYYHNSCYHAQIQNAVMLNKEKILKQVKEMFPGSGEILKGAVKDGR